MKNTSGKTVRRLWRRLNRELGFDIPEDSAVQKIVASEADKSAGAFSWVLINWDAWYYNERIGSQWSISYLLKCPELGWYQDSWHIQIEPKKHPREADPYETGRKQAEKDLHRNHGVIPRTSIGHSERYMPSIKTYENMRCRAECRKFQKKDWDKVMEGYDSYMREHASG